VLFIIRIIIRISIGMVMEETVLTVSNEHCMDPVKLVLALVHSLLAQAQNRMKCAVAFNHES
jgi:hypothetical protein